jgi:hypothetical protein
LRALQILGTNGAPGRTKFQYAEPSRDCTGRGDLGARNKLEDAMDIEEKAKELVGLEIEKRKLELESQIERMKLDIVLEQKKKELELLMVKGEIKRFQNA